MKEKGTYDFIKKVTICRVICNECGCVYSKEYLGTSSINEFISNVRSDGWTISPAHQYCPRCNKKNKDEIIKNAVEIREAATEEKLEKRTIHNKVKQYCEKNKFEIDVPENIADIINKITLTKNEKEVYIGREIDRVSLEVLGNRLGISRQRVNKIEESVVEKISEHLKTQSKIKNYVEGKEWEQVKIEDIGFSPIIVKTFDRGQLNGDFERISTVKDIIDNRALFKNIMGFGKTREIKIYNKMVELGVTNQTFNEWRS